MCYKDEEQEEQQIIPRNCSRDTKTKTLLQPHLSAYALTSLPLLCVRRRRTKEKKEEKE